MQQKEEGLSSPANPTLQEEEGLKDHVTSTAKEIAMEPEEGGCGYNTACYIK